MPNEIWLRPHPWLTLDELTTLVSQKRITATPRFGDRTNSHPKGYALGERTTLAILDKAGTTVLTASVRITDLVVKRLGRLGKRNLAGCGELFPSWLHVHKILGFFEKRELDPREKVTIVKFDYEEDV